jgi:uncharacterized protein YuzE
VLVAYTEKLRRKVNMQQLTEDGQVLISISAKGKVIGCYVEFDKEASCECIECDWAECQMRGKVA